MHFIIGLVKYITIWLLLCHQGWLPGHNNYTVTQGSILRRAPDSAIAILKFLMILLLNLGFVNEVQLANEANA